MLSRPSPLLLLALLAVGCAAPMQRFEYEQPKMGTQFKVVLYARSQEKADAAAEAAFERADQLNAVFSNYEPESELSRMCAMTDDGVPAGPVPVSSEMWEVLEASAGFSQVSGGAFDVTVGPFVSLWKRSIRQGELPTAEQISAARRSVGWDGVRLDAQEHSVVLDKPGMRIDLGGIAKGYTLDEMLRVMEAEGVDRALVDGGGDVAVSRAPPREAGWKIALFSGEGEVYGPPLVIEHSAVCTSGASARFAEIKGERYSHIIDPRSGLGLTDFILVNVVARDGMTADALASAVSVLGHGDGLDLAEDTRGVEARLVTTARGRGVVLETTGFPSPVRK